LMEAIRSGKAPNLAGLLGKERDRGLFEHGYAAPRALSILPSSTIPAWSALFTGAAPAIKRRRRRRVVRARERDVSSAGAGIGSRYRGCKQGRDRRPYRQDTPNAHTL
jgi:hypothetical protein